MTSAIAAGQTSVSGQPAAYRTKASLAAGDTAGKILVVEDEPEILEPLAYSLRQAGFAVLCAENGLTACRLIGSEQPDLILLDIMLPDLNGWEVCRLLRQHPEPGVARIPVIMLTALSSPEDKYRGLEIGADLFLPKPYSLREIILHAEKLICRHRKTMILENRVTQLASQDRQSHQMHHVFFHELRNQLHILSGFSELLSMNPHRGDSDACRDAICRSSSYLQNLAEEILLIRELEDSAPSLRGKILQVGVLIFEIIQIYQLPAREKSMQIEFLCEPPSPQISLNPAALKIILSALLDNSIKYGLPGQVVRLHCQQGPDGLVITVADQGPGIPAEDQERIFAPYVRGRLTPEAVVGSGLGLYAVQVLCKGLGGDVTLESSPGQGSRFRIRLPDLVSAAIGDTDQ